MKIIFLCGSLEPGKDGVGDYVRRLACELIRQGHQVAAASINDGHVANSILEVQTADNVQFSVLRIGSGCMDKQRRLMVKEWINNIDPDWISLQFVPYAFHSKGLPFNLSKYLKYWGEERRWHIMFHELWVGTNTNSGVPQFLLGWLQKRIVSLLILRLNPVIIHTHTQLYQAILKQAGYNAEYLPLISNIPVVNMKDNSFNEDIIQTSEKIISLVMFGSIHAGGPVEQFARDVQILSRERKKRICLLIIGRSGPEQKNWVTAWKLAGLDVKLLGEQPAERISEILSNASIGISTTPISIIEKSGTAAAMRDHGLSVLCIRSSHETRGLKYFIPKPIFGVLAYKDKASIETGLSMTRKVLSAGSNLSKVSRQLADALLVGVVIN